MVAATCIVRYLTHSVSASDHFDFWICYRGSKNKKYVFFLFFSVFLFGGWKLRSKLGLKNHFCGKNGLFENLVSQSYFAFKDTKFVHWHYSPIFNSSRDIPQKWFFNPNFERCFHPPPPKYENEENKKIRIFYFRSSITYPKIEMIGGGYLRYSPCEMDSGVSYRQEVEKDRFFGNLFQKVHAYFLCNCFCIQMRDTLPSYYIMFWYKNIYLLHNYNRFPGSCF